MLLTLSLLLAATLATANAASITTFTVPGCDQTAPAAINDLNEVFGTATCGGIATAFIRDPAGHFTTFTIDGKPTTATGINIHGSVVGSYTTQQPAIVGYVRSPEGVITVITNPPGFQYELVLPVAINARGQIAGTVNANPAPQAFFRDMDGTFTVKSPWQGFKGATVTGLTDEGAIAGAAFETNGIDTNQAFILAANGTLNIVGPPAFGGGGSWVIGIERLGVNVIGFISTLGEIEGRPVLTTQGFTQTATGAPKLFPVPFTGVVGLFTPPKPPVSGGINSHGAAVLSPAFVASNGQSIYIAPDGTVSTIELGPCQNVAAKAINDNGWVTGSCSGEGFLWRK